MNEEKTGEELSDFKGSPLDNALHAVGGAFKGKKSGNKTPKPKKESPFTVPEGDDISAFKRTDNIVRKVLRFFCWLSAIALIVIMMIAVINVCGEKLRSAGVTWATGIPNSLSLIQYFHIPLVFLAAGYVTLDQGHTRIDLLIQKWPIVEKVAMLVGHVLGAILSFFICYRGVAVTLVKDFSKHMHIASTATSPLEWPFTVCHCVGFFMLGVSFVWALVRMIRFWKYPGVNAMPHLYPEEQPHEDEPVSDDNNAQEVTEV